MSYTLHRHSTIKSGFNQATESGYSVYLFSGNPSDYCVIKEAHNFNNLRTNLCIAFGLLEIGITVLLPLIMVYTYKRFVNRMRLSKTLKYFVMAMIILSIFIVIFLYGCNIFSVYRGLQKPTNFTDVIFAFHFLIAALVIFPLLDFIVIYGVTLCIHFKEKKSCSVDSLRYEVIPDEENDQRLNKLGYISLYCSMVLSLLLTQLVFLNVFYTLLAVTAAPVETGSLTILYITSLFSLLAFFAFILKIFFETNFAYPKKLQNYAAKCCCFVPLIFLVLLLAAGIGMLVVFIYTYTVLIQEYRNDRGVLTFFSSFVPSVFATGIGYFWVKMLDYVGKEKKKLSAKNILKEILEKLRINE